MEIEKFIEHTNVNPNCTKEDIIKLVEEAKQYNFYAVVVLPYYTKMVKELLANTNIKVCTVIGFPYGCQTTKAKLTEIKDVFDYIDELDVVMNRAAFKNKDYDFVSEELKKIVKRSKDKIVKVIVETPELSEEEIKKASEIVLNSKAHFIKTAVGLKGPTELKHVEIIKEVVGEKIRIKASGGIRDYNKAVEFIKRGASRIGSSASVEIIKGRGG
ncbi:MAG: deoxyribose-phosphate aldolase [Candidatus Aenigmarchaeota archaeon]|nr:deoxyribose-phosphate aldolase [Candidatus Aenigmarchaeota archaeon]MDW8149440.1 deoxyribose-phosphate aldolase [Candidatus Aenigmarchaeota archaeon]